MDLPPWHHPLRGGDVPYGLHHCPHHLHHHRLPLHLRQQGPEAGRKLGIVNAVAVIHGGAAVNSGTHFLYNQSFQREGKII